MLVTEAQQYKASFAVDKEKDTSSERKAAMSISRRDFVKGAVAGTGALAGASALTGCAPAAAPVSNLPEKWDYAADVVVVGYGGAGATAAIEAGRAGSKVLILEREPTSGGASGICAGTIYMGGGNGLQEACGFTDTPDNMYNYLSASMGAGADLDWIRLYCDRSVEFFNWLVDMGVQFRESFLPGLWDVPPTDDGLFYSGQEQLPHFRTIAEPAPRCCRVAGPGAAKGLWPYIGAAVEAAGAQVLHEAPAKRVVVSGEGRVIGVVADVQGEEKYVKGNKAVILCAGGYGANKDMVAQHCPHISRVPYHAGVPGSDGTGIRMGQAVGADVRMMGEGSVFLFIYDLAQSLMKGILVNHIARRFINEDNSGEIIGDLVAKTYPTCYLIIDAAIWNDIPDGGKESKPPIAQADTIAELAAALDMTPGFLEDTVTRYNGFAAKGEDPVFQKDSSYCVPLEAAPFCALDFSVETLPWVNIGGLRTNTKGQVLKPNGQPLQGLYGAGTNVFSVVAEHNGGMGTSLGSALFTGRIAGKNAAAEEAWG
jgi:3-oxo-5alpha-steroid 4-dehydrogenase